MQREFAKLRRKRLRGHQIDQVVASGAILDERRDGDHLQSKLLLEFDELGQASDRAIVVYQFANHAHGRLACEHREVDGRFGMAGSLEHATWAGAQGEHVSRLDELLRARLRVG